MHGKARPWWSSTGSKIVKLLMSITSGGCFLAVLGIGYAQDNPLPTTLLRATIAMLAGLLLARWWGLTIRKQLAYIFLDDLKHKEAAASDETSDDTETDANQQTAGAEVAAGTEVATE